MTRIRFLSVAIILSLVDESLQCWSSRVEKSDCKSLGERNLPCGDLTTLKVVQILFRHGDRAPIFSYPSDPYKNVEEIWSVKRGELTKTGAQQLYTTGQFYRRRYNGFIDRSYSSKDVYTMSSNVDRSISSAQAFLSGLFHDDGMGFSVVPIHDIPSEKDNKIHFSAHHLKCPAYDHEMSNNEDNMKAQYTDHDRKLFTYLETHTGAKFSNWFHVYRLYDTLFIQELYNLKLPNWTIEVYPDAMRDMIERIPNITFHNRRYLRLRGGPLLSLMLQRIDNLIGHRSSKTKANVAKIANSDDSMQTGIKAKMYLYSGHESTITALLSALGIFQDQIPPYASSIIMELHSPSKGQCGRQYVQVLYRNSSSQAPNLLKIPGCSPPCYLDQLKKIAEDVLVDSDWAWIDSCHDFQYNFIYEFFYSCSCENTYGFNSLRHGTKLLAKTLYSKTVNWIGTIGSLLSHLGISNEYDNY